MNHLRSLLLKLVLLACLTLLGCTPWDVSTSEKKPWKLPTPRMSPSTVVVEVAFVRLNPQLPQESSLLWQDVDEQILTPELRKRLNANGIRCGVIGTQLPPAIQQLLDQESDGSEVTSQDPEKLADDVTSRKYRLQSREGVRTPVAASTNVETLNVLISDDEGVRGETYRTAQCIFAVRTFPKGDGRVQVEITPEVEHGEPRNRYIGQEGVMRIEFKREQKEFDALRMAVMLSPGDVFAISATPEPVGLGQSFFVKGPQQSTMLLIRLAQTQKDHLFEAADSE